MRYVTRRAWLAGAAKAGALVAASAALPGCGYALAGRGSFLPDYIKVIGVPPFANPPPIFNLETQMTEKGIGRAHV